MDTKIISTPWLAYLEPRPGLTKHCWYPRVIRVTDGQDALLQTLTTLGIVARAFTSERKADEWLDDERETCFRCQDGMGKYECAICAARAAEELKHKMEASLASGMRPRAKRSAA